MASFGGHPFGARRPSRYGREPEKQKSNSINKISAFGLI